MFDRIIIKEDYDKRGRDAGEVADLIVKGILQEKSDACYETVLDEKEAIRTGLDRVVDGGLVVITPESVTGAIAILEDVQARVAK